MRGTNIIVILLVVGLLIFGCTSPTPPAKPNGTGNNQSTGGSGGASGSSGGTGASGTGTSGSGTGTSGTGTSGTGTSGSTGGSTGTSGGSGEDLTGKGYEALAAMGIPLQCDITVNSTVMKIYMKGKDEVRSEVAITESGATCRKMVSIMKGKVFYTGCADGTLYPQCDWLQMTINATSSGTGTASQEPDYNSVPPAKINCVPWVYDASKFATPGKVCSLDDMMKGYQAGNYPNGYN